MLPYRMGAPRSTQSLVGLTYQGQRKSRLGATLRSRSEPDVPPMSQDDIA